MVDVTLNVDRNGLVTSVDPEAVVLNPDESVTYHLAEPGRKTNWEFLGVQFGCEHQGLFRRVEVNLSTLTLHTAGDLSAAHVDVTLLYTIDKDFYYADNDEPSNKGPSGKLKKRNSVKAFDPLVITEN